MYDVDTRDKYKPHYGMNNLNSRQEKRKGKILLQEKENKKNKKNNSKTFLRLR